MQQKDDAPIRIFLSSASEDKALLEELKKCLEGLKQKISVWDDSNVNPDEDRQRVIGEELNAARVILLLITENYINSNDCYNIMLSAMNRQKDTQTCVIPIILDSGNYVDEPFYDLETLISIGLSAIAKKNNSNDSLLDVARNIQQIIEDLLKREQSNTPSSPDPKLPSGEPSLSASRSEAERVNASDFNDTRETRVLRPLSAPLLTRYTSSKSTWNQLITEGCYLQIKPLLIIVLIIVATIIAALVVNAAITIIFPHTTVVIITPQSSQQNRSYLITAVAGTPDALQHQVQARLLSSPTFSQSKTVKVTGIFQKNGSQATGKVTLYNGKTVPQFVAKGTHIGNKEVLIATDEDVTIPAANPPTMRQITVNAHAVNTGVNGNIASGYINEDCCIAPMDHTIFAKNSSPFTGGEDGISYRFVQQSDIDGAASSLVQSLEPMAQKSLLTQMHANEELITEYECTPKVSSNHNAPDKVDKVDVSVSVTCSSAVSDKQAVEKAAVDIFKQEATQVLGISYALVSKKPNTKVILGSVIDVKNGTATFQVKVEGKWVYQFDTKQKESLIKRVVGKTRQDASKELEKQTGVLHVHIDDETVSTDPAHIRINIDCHLSGIFEDPCQK